MNALVVYDTMAGNTERVARIIAGVLAVGGQTRAVPLEQFEPGMLRRLDLLALGSPTQRRRPTPRMRGFIDGLGGQAVGGLAVAAFDTRFNMPAWMTGSAANVLARALRRRGAVLLGPPESFYVLGKQGPLAASEPGRAEAWARKLRGQVEALNVQRLTLSHV